MSGSGAPSLGVDGAGLRVGLVHATWHRTVIELPVAASRLAASGLDAVVALGVVIRGGTPHFDYVCAATAHGLMDVAVRTGIPVGFGLLTCDTVEQALARAGLPGSVEDKGHEAVGAALATAVALRGLPAPSFV
jgi:6,7-dimethyl-8-ribityllumazine synthase